jgi:hypothetical protein
MWRARTVRTEKIDFFSVDTHHNVITYDLIHNNLE